jgi:hypothetical protein
LFGKLEEKHKEVKNKLHCLDTRSNKLKFATNNCDMFVWKCSKVVWQHSPEDNFSENGEPSTSLEEKFGENDVASLSKVDHKLLARLQKCFAKIFLHLPQMNNAISTSRMSSLSLETC